MAIGVARRGARRSGERALRIPPPCSDPVSHACGPHVASSVRRSSVCALASAERACFCLRAGMARLSERAFACGRVWRAAQRGASRKKERLAQREAKRKKERPARKRVGTLTKKKEKRRACCEIRGLSNNELNESASSQYAPFSHKTALFSFLGGATPKKREQSRERTWTAEAPSTNFAHLGVRERAKNTIVNRVRSISRARCVVLKLFGLVLFNGPMALLLLFFFICFLIKTKTRAFRSYLASREKHKGGKRTNTAGWRRSRGSRKYQTRSRRNVLGQRGRCSRKGGRVDEKSHGLVGSRRPCDELRIGHLSCRQSTLNDRGRRPSFSCSPVRHTSTPARARTYLREHLILKLAELAVLCSFSPLARRAFVRRHLGGRGDFGALRSKNYPQSGVRLLFRILGVGALLSAAVLRAKKWTGRGGMRVRDVSFCT